MGIQKNFVVKNGLEVGTNLIFAQDGQVGIGSTIPEATFDVTGSLNADFATNASLNVTGIATILDGEATLWEVLGSDGQSGFSTFWSQNVVGFSSIQELRVVGISTFEDQVRIVGITTIVNNNLHVGAGGTVFHTSTAGFVGINTDSPEYLLDVRSSGTGVTALYVKGDVTITGDLKVDDLQFDDLDAQDANIVGFVTVGGGAASLGGQTHLHVIGISSMQNLRVVGFTTLGAGGSDEDGQTHLHVIGITSTKNLDVTGFGTVHNQFRTRTAISTDLSVTGVGTIQELRVTGFSTVQENLNVQGITSTGNLNIVGQTTSYNIEASGFGTVFNQFRSRSAISTDLHVSGVGTINELRVTGFSTVQDDLHVLGITSTKNLDVTGFGTVHNQLRSRTAISTDLNVSGVGTIQELRVTGFTTVQQNLNIQGITSTGNLNIVGQTTSYNIEASGFGTVFNQFRSRSAVSTDLYVSGVGTIQELRVTGFTTVQENLNIQGITSTGNLNIVGQTTSYNIEASGFGTVFNQFRARSGVFTDTYTSGISTVGSKLHVGVSGTAFRAEVDGVTGLGSIGINTDNAQYSLHVASASTEGTVVAYIEGDLQVSGDIIADDITLDDVTLQDVNITGFTTIGHNLNVLGITSVGNFNVVGQTTTRNFAASGFATVFNQLRSRTAISTDLNVSGVGTIQELRVTGFTTVQQNLNIQGITSTGNLNVVGQTTTRNFAASGFATVFNQLRSRTAISTDLSVTGVGTINELRVTGFSTVNENLNVQGITSTGNFEVVGVSTFTNTVDIDASADVSGNLSVGSFNVLGVSTYGGAVDINSTVNAQGDVTFQSDLDVLGITSTKNLDVTGFGTVHNQFRANSGIFTDLHVTGMSTFFNVGFGSTVGFTSSVFFADGAVLNFGSDNDLLIYHDGNDSYIKDVGTGAINIHGSPASFIGNSNGDTLLKAVEGGGVELYYAGAILAETTAEGFTMHGVGVATHLSITGIATVGVSSFVFFNEGQVNVQGIVTAASFRGEGQSLTGIETSVHTSARWSSTDAGINTTRNVGIATTNPLNTVQVGAALSSFTVISLGSTVMVGVGTTDPGKTLQVIGDTDIEGVLTLNGSSVPTVGLVIALGG